MPIVRAQGKILLPAGIPTIVVVTPDQHVCGEIFLQLLNSGVAAIPVVNFKWFPKSFASPDGRFFGNFIDFQDAAFYMTTHSNNPAWNNSQYPLVNKKITAIPQAAILAGMAEAWDAAVWTSQVW